MDRAEYFSMQGRVYIGKRNPNGSRAPARWVYDASTLETKQTKEREEKQESWTGSRGVAATLPTKRAMTITLTLGQLNTDNAALAMDGVRVDVVAGTVTAEAIGSVQPGDVIALAYAAISDLVLEDSLNAPLVEDTDYTVDEALGIITFLTAKTGVEAAYDYAAHSLVTALNAPNEDVYILFAGLNTVDGSMGRCRGEVHNVSMDPAETFGMVQSGFGEIPLTGTAKVDPVRAMDPRWGPFGRLFLIDTDA